MKTLCFILPPTAEEAASDLDRLCSCLGTSSLSRDDFVNILSACGLAHSERLFDKIVNFCIEAEEIAIGKNGFESLSLSSSLQVGELDGNALRYLYAFHPAYVTCHNPAETALALTDRIEELYEESMADGTTFSRHERAKNLLKSLAIASSLSSQDGEEKKDDMTDKLIDYDIESAVNELMTPQKEEELRFDLETVASSLLRYKGHVKDGTIDPKLLFQGVLQESIFDPFHADARFFVATLEAAVLNHDALNHHVLTSFSMGSWGGLSGTITHLANFMEAYRHFTSTFCEHLKQTLKMVGEVDPTGHHVEILKENMEEEQGIYDDEAIEMIQSLGLDAKKLYNVAHKDLYVQCCNGLRQLSRQLNDENRSNDGLTQEQCRYIAEPLIDAFEAACDPTKGATAATAMAAMHLGSELIVTTLYSKLCAFLASSADNDQDCPVTKQHLAFFLLHIDMDVDHADKIRYIVVSLATDETTRLQMAYAIDTVLKARIEFCDRFVEVAFPPTGHGGEESANLYNTQRHDQVGMAATYLSIFTGHPVVFEMCSPFVAGAHILDVGCGDGYCARKLVEMGARKIVGLDVSEEMIERARENPFRSSCEKYEMCDPEKVVEKLTRMPTALGLIPGHMLNGGCFDLAVALLLFNDTSITKMKAICKQVYQTLKPGGHFIFSVPHPFMFNAHGDDDSIGSTISFANGDARPNSYFSLSDRKFTGVTRTLDGHNLNIKMQFKSVSDYTKTVSSIGFSIAKMHEARVLPEHVAMHPEFFFSVKDSPLQLVFDVVKPQSCAEIGRIPKAIAWSPFEKANANQILSVVMPELVSYELVDFTIATYAKGVTVDTFSPTNEDAIQLRNVAAFAADLRYRLLGRTGAVCITGLDMDRLVVKDTNEASADTGRAKLAYYVLSSLIGKVNQSARGRLFDVVDKGLDTNADNVLFSVSSATAPYHTDGASADKAYDAVGLFCINPASTGGELHLSNAANAIQSLKKNIPKFILHELFRPLPRDVMENGSGQGVNQASLMRFSRCPDLLKLRIRHNAYPIFEEGTSGRRDDLIRFRYMRHWIETGHSKGNVPLSPLLKLALDALDSALDDEQVASIKMKSGDIVYCNNMSFAHARTSFTNDGSGPSRHMVRVWLNLDGSDPLLFSRYNNNNNKQKEELMPANTTTTTTKTPQAIPVEIPFVPPKDPKSRFMTTTTPQAIPVEIPFLPPKDLKSSFMTTTTPQAIPVEIPFVPPKDLKSRFMAIMFGDRTDQDKLIKYYRDHCNNNKNNGSLASLAATNTTMTTTTTIPLTTTTTLT